MHSTVVADYLGLNLVQREPSTRRCDAVRRVCHAANAVRQGQCENVVVAFGDNRRTGFSKGDDGVSSLATEVGHPEFENPFGPLVPSMYALIAQKHMATYGTTGRKSFATVAVACREHASMRGAGQHTEPIDVDDVLSLGADFVAAAQTRVRVD